MDTIIIVIKDSDDCLRLKEFLSSDYHIVICSELENIIDTLNDNRIVAIIMDLDDATEVNVAKYSSYKNIDNIQIPLIVGGNFTGNLLNLLNLGVSEVIVKPYNEAIIKLRINNAIRRAEDNEYRIMADFDTLTKIYNRTAFYIGDLAIYPDRHEVRVGDEVVDLTKKEFDLLLFLAKNKNRVLKREEVLEKVWGYGYAGKTNIVDVYVRYLRSKIDEKVGKKYIHTVRGIGYVARD